MWSLPLSFAVLHHEHLARQWCQCLQAVHMGLYQMQNADRRTSLGGPSGCPTLITVCSCLDKLEPILRYQLAVLFQVVMPVPLQILLTTHRRPAGPSTCFLLHPYSNSPRKIYDSLSKLGLRSCPSRESLYEEDGLGEVHEEDEEGVCE